MREAHTHWGVTLRKISRFARRAGLIGCCVAAAALAVASCSQQPTAQAGSAAAKTAVASAGPTDQARVLAIRDPFGGCEQRIEGGPRDLRAMAIVGASYTAGVGPDNPALSWAADLARKLRWEAARSGPRTGDRAGRPR
jgi:hypothetical protein